MSGLRLRTGLERAMMFARMPTFSIVTVLMVFPAFRMLRLKERVVPFSTAREASSMDQLRL